MSRARNDDVAAAAAPCLPPSLKFSIAHRLFLTVLLSVLAAAAIGLGLVRWQLFGSAADYSAALDTERVDRALVQQLADVLALRFDRRKDWSFLPAEDAARRRWLRSALQALPALDRTRQLGPLLSTNLGDRLGLLDKHGQWLAGVLPHPLVIAFASIDTIHFPVVVDGRKVGNLVLARTRNPDGELAAAFLVQQQDRLLVAIGLGVLLSALAAAALAAHFRRPIRALVAGARRLEDGHFDSRLDLRRSDELGALAEAFNRLAARLDDTERARRQWVADTSHELRTPLSVLRAQLEALQDGIRHATPETIATMLRQVLSLNRRIDELYELARADLGQMHYELGETELWPLVEDVVASFADKFRAAGLVATLGPRPAQSTVHGDAERLRQVLVNLLENSVRYTDAGGRVEIGCAQLGDSVQLTIDDSAPGPPASALPRLGERFFRVESERNRALGGAGLGLALCRQILEAHGGRLEFHASGLGGLQAVMVLPLERAS